MFTMDSVPHTVAVSTVQSVSTVLITLQIGAMPNECVSGDTLYDPKFAAKAHESSSHHQWCHSLFAAVQSADLLTRLNTHLHKRFPELAMTLKQPNIREQPFETPCAHEHLQLPAGVMSM